jgi:nucleoside-diphosphate-sugar epimerase
VRPLPEIAAAEPQSHGAPLPEVLPAPHEWSVVDVTNYEQVLEAARGMDSLINCTVIRPHQQLAFQVNMLGAFNIVKAAVELGIKRIINTGPQMVVVGNGADYYQEFDVPDEAPERPGGELYTHTKYLGAEIVRVFAERHGLEVAEFRYCGFRPAHPPTDKPGSGLFYFMTAWEDTGPPFLHALRAPSKAFERPFERFHLASGGPHGKFRNTKAARLLGWTPEHDFSHLWRRPMG